MQVKKKRKTPFAIGFVITLIMTTYLTLGHGNMTFNADSQNPGDVSDTVASSAGTNNPKVGEPGNDETDNGNNKLRITFINVGQGDSILVQCGAQNMLIDAGPTDAASEVSAQLKKQKIGKVDVLIGTHPHEDHIGSMDMIINNYETGQIYMPEVTASTKAFREVVTAVKNKGLKLTAPVAGSSFRLGAAVCTILAPNNKSYEELNNYSIVIKMVYGKTSFIFTGDAMSLSEKEMLETGYDLSADVLKIGHHGSYSSTSDEFLNAVAPKYAVIMCGRNNDYNFPHEETVKKLENDGISVYRTDENGTIVCTSDGKTVRFDKEPGSYDNGKE